MKKVLLFLSMILSVSSLFSCKRANSNEEIAAAVQSETEQTEEMIETQKSRLEEREGGRLYVITSNGEEVYVGTRSQSTEQETTVKDELSLNADKPDTTVDNPASLPENRIISEMEQAGLYEVREMDGRKILYFSGEVDQFDITVTDEKLANAEDIPAREWNEVDRRYFESASTAAIVEDYFKPIHGKSRMHLGSSDFALDDSYTNAINTIHSTFYAFEVTKVLKGALNEEHQLPATINVIIDSRGLMQGLDGKYCNVGYKDFTKKTEEERHYVLALCRDYYSVENYYIMDNYCFADVPETPEEEKLRNLAMNSTQDNAAVE